MLRALALTALSAAALSTALLVAAPAQAVGPQAHMVVFPEDELAAVPAHRYANLSNAEVFAELDRRGVPYQRIGRLHGVQAPIRLTGPLRGIVISSTIPPEQRATSLLEVLDGRLALALHDFAELLARHDVVEVVHYNMYRPNGALPPVDPPAEPAAGARRQSPTARRPTGKGAPTRAQKPAKPDEPNKPGRAAKRNERDRKPAPAPRARKTEPKPSRAAKKPSKAERRRLAREAKAAKAAKGKPAEKGAERSATPTEPKPSSRKPRADKRRADKPATPAPRQSPRKSAPKKGAPKKGGAEVEAEHEDHSEVEPITKGTYAPPGTRHPAGFAIDIGAFRKSNGDVLSVVSHFQGKIGQGTCGAGVPAPANARARELRAIVCEAAELGLFSFSLTPNYNAPHADHFHLEIHPTVKYLMVH